MSEVNVVAEMREATRQEYQEPRHTAVIYHMALNRWADHVERLEAEVGELEGTDMMVARVIRSTVTIFQNNAGLRPDFAEIGVISVGAIAREFANEFFPINTLPFAAPGDNEQLGRRKEFMVACGFDTP